MKKSDLENGMIVETRNGERYILIKNFKSNDFINIDVLLKYPKMNTYNRLDQYDNDLFVCNCTNNIYDIMKVYCTEYPSSNYLVLLWERKEIKLTEDERKLLEVAYNQGYKWIARDKHGNIYVYNIEPKKERNYWNNYDKYIRIYKDLFTFIKWEDEEPYNIKYLLKGDQNA